MLIGSIKQLQAHYLKCFLFARRSENHSRVPKFHFNQHKKVSEYASLDNIDKQNYVKAMTTARDTHNQIEYAKEIAHEEGLEEGLAKGRVKCPAKTGRTLLCIAGHSHLN